MSSGLSSTARTLLPHLAADFSGSDADLCERFSLRPDQLSTLKAGLLASGVARPTVLAMPASFGADQLLFTLGRLPRREPVAASRQELARLTAPFPQILWTAAGPELFLTLGAFTTATDLELYVERLEGWLHEAPMGDSFLLEQWRFPLALTALPHFWDFSSSLLALGGSSSDLPPPSELRSGGEAGKPLGDEKLEILAAWMEQPLASATELGKAAHLSLRKAQRIREELLERKIARTILSPDLAKLGLRILSVVHLCHLERRTLRERLRLLRSSEAIGPFLSLERAQQAVNCFAYPTLGDADGQLAALARLAARQELLREAPKVYHLATAQLEELRPLSMARACREALRRS